MSRRSRSRSKSTYYSEVGEQYVDIKSKQLLFHQAALCTLGRTRLEENQTFDKGTARDLIEKHLKKRKSHGFVLCLVDRLRFQKKTNTASKSYRKDLTYREIKHFYLFKDKPAMFTLGVEEETTKKRTYESFKCKDEADVLMLHNLTGIAFQDPQFLLRHASPIRQICMSPDLNDDSRLNNGPINSNTVSMISTNPNRNSTAYYSPYERQNSPILLKPLQRQTSPPSQRSSDDLTKYQGRAVSIDRRLEQKMSPISQRSSDDLTKYRGRAVSIDRRLDQKMSPISQRSSDELAKYREHVVSIDRRSDQQTAPPPRRLSDELVEYHNRTLSIDRRLDQKERNSTVRATMSTECLHWKEEITYLKVDVEHGPQLTDSGPIYLYVSRCINTQSDYFSDETLPILSRNRNSYR